MLKVNSSKKFLKQGSSLILASLLLASVFNNDVSTVHAVNDEEYASSIYDELFNSDLSKETRGILKAMADKTDSRRVLSDISIALDDSEYRECFIAQSICTFAQEQEKITFSDAYLYDPYNPYLYISYKAEDVCVFDNLKGKSSILPKQICLFTKIADFGDYAIYKVHDTIPSYIITDRDGNILTYSTGDTYNEFNNVKSTLPLKDFLESNGLFCEDSYSYVDIVQDLTFYISEKLSNYSESSQVRVSDVLVIDGSNSLTLATDDHKDFYFISYCCPYLFIDGRNIYKDAVNTNARVTVDEKSTLRYFDETTGTELFDLDMHYVDGGSSTSALVKFKDFAKDRDIKVGFYVCDDQLVEISNALNNTGAALNNTYK